MNAKKQLDNDVSLSRYEYEDGVTLAADIGPARDADVDVLDDTVIVVVDGEQYDLSVDGDAEAFIKNGVLTIEVDG